MLTDNILDLIGNTPLFQQEMPGGTLRAILRSAGLSPAEFKELLKS